MPQARLKSPPENAGLPSHGRVGGPSGGRTRTTLARWLKAIILKRLGFVPFRPIARLAQVEKTLRRLQTIEDFGGT